MKEALVLLGKLPRAVVRPAADETAGQRDRESQKRADCGRPAVARPDQPGRVAEIKARSAAMGIFGLGLVAALAPVFQAGPLRLPRRSIPRSRCVSSLPSRRAARSISRRAR